MRNFLLLAFLLFYSTTALSQYDLAGQITLKKHDDPNIGGYKSIIFEYEEEVPGQRGQKQKVTKEFDVEMNNPFFYKMGVKENASRSKGGIPALNIDQSALNSLKSRFIDKPGNSARILPQNAESGLTHAFVREESNFVVISYNLFLLDEEGYHLDQGGRFASIHILDKKGSIMHIVDVPTDAYGTAVSENGKYLAYGFGETLHDTPSGSIDSGFRIIDLETNQTYYQFKTSYVSGISVIYDMLVVALGKVNFTLDAGTGNLYGPDEYQSIRGYFRFRSNGIDLDVSDLTRIK